LYKKKKKTREAPTKKKMVDGLELAARKGRSGNQKMPSSKKGHDPSTPAEKKHAIPEKVIQKSQKLGRGGRLHFETTDKEPNKK